MITATLIRLTRSIRRALLCAHLAQLQLARSHIARTQPGDHITLLRVDALIAETRLELTLLTAQAQAQR